MLIDEVLVHRAAFNDVVGDVVCVHQPAIVGNLQPNLRSYQVTMFRQASNQVFLSSNGEMVAPVR